MLSGADQKNSGVSSTVDSRLTAAFWMNTLPMSCAISFRFNVTRPAEGAHAASLLDAEVELACCMNDLQRAAR